jgi:uncharacterized protein YciI
MRSLSSFLFVLALFLTSCASGPETPNNGEAFARPQADWRQYYFGLLRTGPDFAKAKGEEGKAIQEGHRKHVLESIQAGELILAGAFQAAKRPADADAKPREENLGSKVRGILIFTTYDLGDVDAWAAEDPALKAGVFKLQVLTWVGPKGLTFQGREAMIQEIMQPAKN